MSKSAHAQRLTQKQILIKPTDPRIAPVEQDQGKISCSFPDPEQWVNLGDIHTCLDFLDRPTRRSQLVIELGERRIDTYHRLGNDVPNLGQACKKVNRKEDLCLLKVHPLSRDESPIIKYDCVMNLLGQEFKSSTSASLSQILLTSHLSRSGFAWLRIKRE